MTTGTGTGTGLDPGDTPLGLYLVRITLPDEPPEDPEPEPAVEMTPQGYGLEPVATVPLEWGYGPNLHGTESEPGIAVHSITPSSGLDDGGGSYTITGRFDTAQGVTVSFGSTVDATASVVDAQTITGTVPAGTGSVDVTVEQGGEAVFIRDGFTYIAGDVLASENTAQTASVSTWNHDYFLPDHVNLLLITVGFRVGTVNSLSFGGVTPTLLEKNDGDWPQTYLYAIAAADLPALDQSHTLTVNSSESSTGVTSICALRNVAPSVLADLGTIPTATTYANNTSVSTDVSLGLGRFLLVDAVTAREGGENMDVGAGQDRLFYTMFDNPRGAGSSTKEVMNPDGLVTMSWSGAASNRIRHVVAGIEME